MKRFLLFLCLFFPCKVYVDENDQLHRIESFLTLDDTQMAIVQAHQSLQTYPHSLLLKEALLKALSAAGEEKELLKSWQHYQADFQEAPQKNRLLETLGWGVLRHAVQSKALLPQIYGTVGSVLTQDSYGVGLLLKHLRGSNWLLRGIAVDLSPLLRDASLKAEICRLLGEERSPEVRLKAIEAVGKLHLLEAQGALQAILAEERGRSEEKAAAIASLVAIKEKVEEEELLHLSRSNRFGLRALACALLVDQDRKESLPLLTPLLKDPHPEVRFQAFRAHGLLQGGTLAQVRGGLTDPDARVGITAAWALLMREQEEGERAYIPYLKHANVEVRRLAAASLAVAGENGISLLRTLITSDEDTFVRANAALGLIGYRVEELAACQSLEALLSNKQPLMCDKSTFSLLKPSHLTHAHGDSPEAVDHLTRLEVLNTLAILHYPGTMELLKTFLREKRWGVTGVAAATLLQEGDQAAAEVVRQLLEDEELVVRLQAALVLAALTHDPAATQVLQNAYPQADHELRIRILEALGAIGDPGSLPFLTERLYEPFQTERAVAASSLIRCLNH